MFNRQEAFKAFTPTLVKYIENDPYAVSDRLFFYTNYIDGYPVANLIGGKTLDPEPFKGKVIIIDEQSVVIQEDRFIIYVLDKSLVDVLPQIGDRVKVTPYYRKEFNGDRLGEVFKKTTQFMDGILIHKHCSKFDGVTRIPGKTIKNASLALLILNLQTFKLSDGYRTITDLFVSASAKNFKVNDPVQSTDDLPPFIEFEVETSKFKGLVKILYVYTSNSYSIILSGSKTLMVSNLEIQEFAAFFEKHLQDDGWKKPQIKILSKAK